MPVPDVYSMEPLELAETIRAACVRAAAAAYEDAGIQGLCEEGRWEAALGAVRALDLRPLLPTPLAQATPAREEAHDAEA